MFEKLHKYVGKSVEALVNRPDAPHVFRLHKKVRHAGRHTAPPPALQQRIRVAASRRATAAGRG